MTSREFVRICTHMHIARLYRRQSDAALPGIPGDEQRLLRELDDARALAACELGAAKQATVYLAIRNPRRQGQHPCSTCTEPK